MKKILYILIGIIALGASSSCNKMEEAQAPDADTKSVKINVTIDEPNATRADAPVARYCLEMYEFSVGATPQKHYSYNGEFDVRMKKGGTYVLLLWADDGKTYQNYDLQAVVPKDQTKITPAYFGNLTVKTEDFDGKITLKRAVTEINFIETTGFTETGNTLTVTYPYSISYFNVSSGTVTRTNYSASIVRSFTDIGATAADGVIATDYILAPATSTVMKNIKFKFNEQAQVVIDKVTIQANYKTNIKGAFKK